MEINGYEFDISQAIHSVALEYSKIICQSEIANSGTDERMAQKHLDIMFSTYLRSIGYLSEKSEAYIRTQLEDY